MSHEFENEKSSEQIVLLISRDFSKKKSWHDIAQNFVKLTLLTFLRLQCNGVEIDFTKYFSFTVNCPC